MSGRRLRVWLLSWHWQWRKYSKQRWGYYHYPRGALSRSPPDIPGECGFYWSMSTASLRLELVSFSLGLSKLIRVFWYPLAIPSVRQSCSHYSWGLAKPLPPYSWCVNVSQVYWLVLRNLSKVCRTSLHLGVKIMPVHDILLEWIRQGAPYDGLTWLMPSGCGKRGIWPPGQQVTWTVACQSAALVSFWTSVVVYDRYPVAGSDLSAVLVRGTRLSH